MSFHTAKVVITTAGLLTEVLRGVQCDVNEDRHRQPMFVPGCFSATYNCLTQGVCTLQVRRLVCHSADLSAANAAPSERGRAGVVSFHDVSMHAWTSLAWVAETGCSPMTAILQPGMRKVTLTSLTVLTVPADK